MSVGNGHAADFALLEARHVDDLIAVMRSLRNAISHLDEAIRAQTAVLREQQRVTAFDAATIARIEQVEHEVTSLKLRGKKK